MQTQDRTSRIKQLGDKIFVQLTATAEERAEYRHLVNEAVLGIPEWHEAPASVGAEVGRKLRAAKAALEAASQLLSDSEDRSEYFISGVAATLRAQATTVEDLATTVKRKI